MEKENKKTMTLEDLAGIIQNNLLDLKKDVNEVKAGIVRIEKRF